MPRYVGSSGLLPRSLTEFSHKDYWEEFFRKRKHRGFEWYGTYPQLCGILHKYVRPKDAILIVGCGNSDLGSDLYDVGYPSVTSIDVSKEAVKQMQRKNGTQRPDMSFRVMDACKMEFEDGSFTCAIDKGTLDAIMPDGGEEAQTRATRMFQEIERVLRVGGRYMCISLLQSHILTHLLNWFIPQGWMVRVCRCPGPDDEDDTGRDNLPFPVFAVVCTKIKLCGTSPILEVSLQESSVVRVQTQEEISEWVVGLQHYAFAKHRMGLQIPETEVMQVDLIDAKSDTEEVRYTLYVIDLPNLPDMEKRFAIFVVPQGRECEWLFGTNEGRHQLAKNVGFGRLVIAHLHRKQSYNGLDQIQKELSLKVMELAPNGFPAGLTVPIFSIGPDAGERNVMFEGESPISGPLVVEDVAAAGDQMLRRMIFLKNQNVVQSEARVVLPKKKPKGAVNTKVGAAGDQHADMQSKVDHSLLSCNHHTLMVAAMSRLPNFQKPSNMLLLGLGAGCLSSFLLKYFEQLHVTALDIDPLMLTISRNYFGLPTSPQLEVVIQDGLEFLQECSKNGQQQYDLILFDVDNKDPNLGMSCPPAEFVEASTLEAVKNCLKPEGVFVLNLVCRDASLRAPVLNRLKETFKGVCSYKHEDEVNEVFHCTFTEEPEMSSVRRGLGNLNKFMARKKKKGTPKILDVNKLMDTRQVF